MKHTYITKEDFGNRVLCDACGDDWTDRPESGGFLFTSKAYCPECAKSGLESIKRYNEMHFIRAYCPAGMSFAQWVLNLRDGNNTITTTTIEE